MSKRHRKSKNFSNPSGDDEDISAYADYDLSMFEAPKGKKPKGRKRRDSHKRAYYDD